MMAEPIIVSPPLMPENRIVQGGLHRANTARASDKYIMRRTIKFKLFGENICALLLSLGMQDKQGVISLKQMASVWVNV